MHEILFRGKRVDNGEWIKGYYASIGKYHYILTGRLELVPYLGFEHFLVNSEAIGRFTGLTDCNGVKIFEGDIIKYFDDWIGKIEYDSDSALFTVSFVDGDYDNFWRISCGDCEVIGNIYDNPELLEVSKSD